MALLTTGSSGITPQFQKYLDKNLLGHAVQETVLADYGLAQSLPMHQGVNSLRFFRGNAGDGSQVVALTEGVTTTARREIAWTPIDVSLVQYGEISEFTDLLGDLALLDTGKQITQTHGEDAALHADGIISSAIIPNISGVQKIYAGGAADWAALAALTPANGKAAFADLLTGMTRLKKNRTPKMNGGYVLIAPPEITFNLMQDDNFTLAGVYGTTKGLFKGEVGTWYNVRVVETTVPWVEDGDAGAESTRVADPTSIAASDAIYACILLGREAFGIPKMGPGSPWSPKEIVVRGASKSDPHNQRTTFAWKTYWNAKLLNDTWAVVLRAKSTFGV